MAINFCHRKLDFNKLNIKNSNNRKKMIIVGGESAGGHLALMANLTQNETLYDNDEHKVKDLNTTVHGCVDIYGARDLLDSNQVFHNFDQQDNMHKYIDDLVIKKKRIDGTDLHEILSPYILIKNNLLKNNKNFPPIFGIHGSYDNLVPVDDCKFFYEELKNYRKSNNQKDVDTSVILDGAHHAFNMLLSPLTVSLSDSSLVFSEYCIKMELDKQQSISKL